MKSLDDLQNKIRDQPEQQIRELLVIKSQMVQEEFEKQISNMNDLQSLMGI